MNRKIVVGFLLLIVFGISVVTYNAVTAKVIKYQDTGMTFNGWTIVTFTDEYKKSKEYKSHTSVECGVQDITVYELDGIEYYFETEFFDFIDTCHTYKDQEYMVRQKPHNIDSSPWIFPIFTYIVYFMNEEDRNAITHEDFNGLGFLKSKDSKYTISNPPYAMNTEPKPFAHQIFEYTQVYLEENSSCLEEFSKVLFEDDEYEYIYTYTSCSENETQHVVGWNSWYSGYRFIDIDEYIEIKIEYMDWETIENTNLGVKTSKNISRLKETSEC